MSRNEKEREFLHDLSNPLAIANGLLEVLTEDVRRKGSLDESQMKRLEKIVAAMDRIKTLVKERRAEIAAEKKTDAA